MVEHKNTTKKQRIVSIGLVAIVVVGLLGFIAYDFWMVNQKTTAILKAPGVVASKDDSQKAGEGSEVTPVTKDELSGYRVAADAPRVLTIDALSISARIRPMSLNSDNSIQAPKNINDSGWYTGSVKPGEAGAMFIDGHASGATRQGLFGYLDTLKNGDTLSVEKGNGKKLKYKVVHVAVVPLDAVDMSKILAPYPGVSNGLNLMSCTGAWVDDAETLDHRVVVYTEQI